MSYQKGNELLDKLSHLLQLHGDPILRQESQLCLTATSVVFLTECFESVSGQQGVHERENVFSQQQLVHNKDRKAITFLHDFLRRTPSLRLVPGACSHFDGLINISCFQALQVLEIKKVPVGFIRGIQSLRPQLKTLTCNKSLISLNEVFFHCGGDLSNAPSAWPQLKNVDFSYNGIVQVDASVKLLPAAEVLNLSHNNINVTEGDESLVNWQYLSDIQHLNLGFNQLECIPVPPAEDRILIFKNMTTLLLKNNNLQNLKGLQAFSKLRVLDVSFNCIVALSELTPLAYLHDLISLNLQGNPVVFCPYYRRATIACLYPIPRVEPIKIDGKPLDSEEQVLLGRNVHPVSMLYYIPEAPVQHQRVRTIRKVEEDSIESSESQEESSDSPSKPRKSKRKNKKGRRVVTREIDFDDGNEGLTSPTDELLTGPSTSTATPIDQALEHADDVENLKKLRQLGGEGWLPAIDQVVHAQEQEEIAPASVHVSAESLLDHASNVIRKESIQSFTDNTIEIHSPSGTFSILSDEDISDGHHYVVTAMSTLDEAEGNAEHLFLTVRDDFIMEKNFAGKVISRLETSLLRDVNMVRTEDNHSVIHLRFDYMSRERQRRDYVMEDYETAVQLAEILEPFVTAKGEMKKVALERLQCLKCSAEFTKPVALDDAFCPDCGSSLTVQVSSPVIPVKPVFTLDHVTGQVIGKHMEASKLNVSSIKTLNGDMSVTPLQQLSSSSSSSSYVEATEEIQKVAKTDRKITSAEDKGYSTNGIGAAKHPDVIPKSTESLDQSPTVPDLCTNTSEKNLSENGKDSSSENEKVQKKYVVKESGKFKVNESGKYTVKDKSSPQIRTSALTSSLKESSKSYQPPPTDMSSTQVGRNGENFGAQNLNGISGIRSKQVDEVIDNRPSTPLESKCEDFHQDDEFMSKSLPADTVNMLQKRPPKTATRKISEQYLSRRSPVQSKLGRSANTDRGPTKSTEGFPKQTKLSSSLPRTPTPKVFFNNLINRLKPGNSPSSSLDSRSSSSGSSSRPTTPSSNVIEPNATLTFRLTADEFSSCDHKLKLYFEVSLFRWGSSEKFCCLLKAPVVIYGETEETPAVMITSSVMFYLCSFSVRGSGTPDECLTPLVSHPLDSLHFIDRGLGSQSFRLEFSVQGGCYDFLVRDKDRCEKFLKVFTNVVQQAKMKVGSRPVVVSPPHPQTLAHIRSQVFKIRPEDPILMGERLHQQAVHFAYPPLVKDRKSLLIRSYSSCFVGREFVDWLIQVKEVETRDEGVGIGQLLLDVGALEHVSKEQVFEDKDQYYRFNTEKKDLAGDSFASESILDIDTNIVLFLMAYRCSNTERPDSSLNAVSVIASRSHIALVKQNPQWPVPRYTALSQPLKDPAFVCLARHKITDVTSLDFFEDDSCFMGISITDENVPVGNGESQWILKTETITTLSSLVKVIKEPWEAQFGVELQKNLYPSVMDHKM